MSPRDIRKHLFDIVEACELLGRFTEGKSLAEYAAAEAIFPDNEEFVFWHAVTLVTNGRTAESLPLFARAFRSRPSWMLLVPRLAARGHLPDDPKLVEKILSVGPQATLPPGE